MIDNLYFFKKISPDKVLDFTHLLSTLGRRGSAETVFFNKGQAVGVSSSSSFFKFLSRIWSSFTRLHHVKSVQLRISSWLIFSHTRTKDLLRKSPYSVQIRENADQKKTSYLDAFHTVLAILNKKNSQNIQSWVFKTYYVKKIFKLRLFLGF